MKLKEGMIKGLSGEYKKRGCGWKIHLTISPLNHVVIYNWLIENCEFGFKYGCNSGQEGKDFTIYVGRFDVMETFALRITAECDKFLSFPKGDVLGDDILITKKVAARFNVPLKSPFHQYGIKGLPYLSEDMTRNIFDVNVKTNKNKFRKEFYTNAYEKLNELYGIYFRGSKNQVTKIVANFLNDDYIPDYVILDKDR